MNAVSALGQFLEKYMLQVNQIIVDAAHGCDDDTVNQVIAHISNAGGKRLRPLMTIACGEIFGYHGQNHVLLAAAVEFIHTATLLHDDVVDESLTRRGVPTANDIWDNKTSVLVGDYLFSQSFKLMVQTGLLPALKILAEASAAISKAEVRQLELIGKLSINLDEYLKLITEKTAMLFAASCQSGAISANASSSQLEAIYGYGLNFGIAFQIMDDHLDYFGIGSNTGKKVGGDFYESKVTAPVLMLLKYASNEEKEYIHHIFSIDAPKSDEDLYKIIDLMNSYNVSNKTKNFARNYVELGEKYLADLPQNQIRDSLKMLIIESVDRVQ